MSAEMAPGQGSPPRDIPAWGVAALIAVTVASAFLPARHNGFVDLDDYANFRDNPGYQGLDRSHLAWAWTTRLLGVYQPLGWMLFEAEYAAFGLDPKDYHEASLALHILGAMALYALVLA